LNSPEVRKNIYQVASRNCNFQSALQKPVTLIIAFITLGWYSTISAQGIPSIPEALTDEIVAATSVDVCTSEIRDKKPRIMVANFYVTYGKKTMGMAIGDYIAQKFEADGRFDVIPRPEIDEKMRDVLKPNLKPEQYLEMSIALAISMKADCVIFGRISRKNNDVLFSVRMASVLTGKNLRKVDETVTRQDANQFLENIGTEFVTYFVTAQPIAKPKVEETKPAEKNHEKGFYLSASGLGAYPLGFLKPVFPIGAGGSFEMGYQGLLSKKLILGLGGDYINYFSKDTKFLGLYSISALGIMGIDIFQLKKFHFITVLYSGFLYGKLTGELESAFFGVGLVMLGERVLWMINDKLGMRVEVRGSAEIVSNTVNFGMATSMGIEWRF